MYVGVYGVVIMTAIARDCQVHHLAADVGVKYFDDRVCMSVHPLACHKINMFILHNCLACNTRMLVL